MTTADHSKSRGLVLELIQSLTQEAQGIPAAQRLAPRPTKPGTLDLTSSAIFVTAVERHALIANHARKINRMVPYENTNHNLGAAIGLFLHALHSLHKFGRRKTELTVSERRSSGWIG